MESLLGLSGATVSYDIILWLVLEIHLLEALNIYSQIIETLSICANIKVCLNAMCALTEIHNLDFTSQFLVVLKKKLFYSK